MFKGRAAATGVRFFVDDLEFPFIENSPTDGVGVQIPWEMADRLTPPNAIYPMVVRRDGNPFELQTNVSIEPGVCPVLARVDSQSSLAKAALPDFRALVSAENPAVAGTTIHTWLYNLGPLDRPVATGASGPSDPPARPVAGIACYLRGLRGCPLREASNCRSSRTRPDWWAFIKWTSRFRKTGRQA